MSAPRWMVIKIQTLFWAFMEVFHGFRSQFLSIHLAYSCREDVQRGEVLYLRENRSEYFRVRKLCAQEVKGWEDGGALKWTIIQCKKKFCKKKKFCTCKFTYLLRLKRVPTLVIFPAIFHKAENFLNISGICNSCNEWFCSFEMKRPQKTSFRSVIWCYPT